jgi:predicted esterase
MSKVEGWQPIETAQTDGSQVLAWIHGAGGDRVTVIEWLGDQWVESYDLEGWNPKYGPTHWQPLPEPPASIKGCSE